MVWQQLNSKQSQQNLDSCNCCSEHYDLIIEHLERTTGVLMLTSTGEELHIVTYMQKIKNKKSVNPLKTL